MKLITYKIQSSENHQIGVIQDNLIYNLNNCFGDISLVDIFQVENYQDQIALHICNNDCVKHDLENINVLPPIPKPNSFRDAYAGEQDNRTLEQMIGEINSFSETVISKVKN